MPRIRVSLQDINAMRQRLATIQSTGNNAVGNIGRVRTSLGWQVTSQQNIDSRLSDVQRRLQNQMELMSSYISFLNTVNDNFSATDKSLRNQANEVLYRLNQMSHQARLPNPPRGGISGIKMAGIASIAGLFGGRSNFAAASTRTPLGILASHLPKYSNNDSRAVRMSTAMGAIGNGTITGKGSDTLSPFVIGTAIVGATVGASAWNWARNYANKLGNMNSPELFYTTIVSGTSGMAAGIDHLARINDVDLGGLKGFERLKGGAIAISAAVDIVKVGSTFLNSRAAGDSFSQSITVAAKETVAASVGVAGAKVGAAGGAKIGAAIGSIFPGPGTVVGAVVGGAVGGFVGSEAGQAAGRIIASGAQAVGGLIGNAIGNFTLPKRRR